MMVIRSQILTSIVTIPLYLILPMGGTGFYIKESLVYVKRDDLKFNSTSNYESTFIEIILPDIATRIALYQFNNLIMMEKVSVENKFCSLMGDFNIDLLKADTNDNVNFSLFYILRLQDLNLKFYLIF